MEQTSVVRATIVVAVAALLEAVLAPYLTFGPFSPRLTLIAIVFSVAQLRELQAVLLGFFGGILLDALGTGLFGVGAAGGLLAGVLASRAGAAVGRGGSEKGLLAQVVGVSILGYDLIGLLARRLAGFGAPEFGDYALVSVLPDAALNALLAYLIGGWVLRAVRTKIATWEGT